MGKTLNNPRQVARKAKHSDTNFSKMYIDARDYGGRDDRKNLPVADYTPKKKKTAVKSLGRAKAKKSVYNLIFSGRK